MPATVLITGASGGIGAAVAEAFATDGRRIVLCARSEAELAATAETVSAAGGTPVVMPVDVGDQEALIDTFAARLSAPVDIVIPAAATMPHPPGERPLDEERHDDFRAVLRTNVYGLFAVLRESIEHMPPDGRILVPSGAVARDPTPGMGAYGVSKAAAEALARGFAADVEQTVGILDPGVVATDLTGGKGRDPETVTGLFGWAAFECPADDLDGQVVGLREWKQATR
jgi:NAD(P)-dependent dehydrogenase (short-subunit alcohol dehydrogenase family)